MIFINPAPQTAKFIWNLAVWIVETLFGLAANTRFSYEMRQSKLHFAKIGRNCQVEESILYLLLIQNRLLLFRKNISQLLR